VGVQNGFVVGLDNGGTANNATVMTPAGEYLVHHLVEVPSRVKEGPAVAVEALAEAMDHVLHLLHLDRSEVLAVGLDTPGPAGADGVISSKGSTNFGHADWRGFDVRSALEARLQLPVVYNNDGNAAALYAHYRHYGLEATRRSSVSVVVGTGLGGGLIENGHVIKGVAGQAGELGHVLIRTDDMLGPGQPMPGCNCGNRGDVESFASLTGIERNLLPYWLTQFPEHDLAGVEPGKAARQVRGYGEKFDPLAIRIFEQQALALGRLFTIAANFTDPNAYFVGGGVVEASPAFRDWFLRTVREHTTLRAEQAELTTFALIPDLDMAGARGSAIAALEALRT
jgi:glucokinase